MRNRAEEFNGIVLEMINDLLDTSDETYEEIKYKLLSQEYGDAKVEGYLNKLFAFTDSRRQSLKGRLANQKLKSL